MINLQELLEFVKSKDYIQNDSYIISYPHIISYFKNIEELKIEDLVRGAHMVYGWMPTILSMDLKPSNKELSDIIQILNKAKTTFDLDDKEIMDVTSIVNNSLVGTSKLLHFISPEHFAIWDSRIYWFIHRDTPHNYRVNKIKNYRSYLTELKDVIKDADFPDFHKVVNEKVGYDVTPMRTIELVMFQKSSKEQKELGEN